MEPRLDAAFYIPSIVNTPRSSGETGRLID